MMNRRRAFKCHTFSLRVPLKIRYGLDLLARKHGIQMSALVLRAIERALEDEGLTSLPQGEFMSLLDRIYHPDKRTRLELLVETLPQLATAEERIIVAESRHDPAERPSVS